MNEQAIDDAVVAQLARAAVAQAAPEELPLFRATSEAYFEDPQSLTRERSGDEMLGFGVEDALVLVTPVALTVARSVLEFVVQEVSGHAQEAGRELIDRIADRLLRRDDGKAGGASADADVAEVPPAPDPSQLTDAQLQQVRALALEKAQQLALPPDKASLLADALVGSLATA